MKNAGPFAFLQNWNKQVASFGNPSAGLRKLTGPASQAAQFQALSGFAKSPSLQSGLSGGLDYFANANPYFAALNMLSGGKGTQMINQGVSGVLRGLGLQKRPPAQNKEETDAYIAAAKQSQDVTNRMLDFAKQQQAYGEQSRNDIELARRRATQMLAEGPSARSVAGMVGATINPVTQANLAAESRAAAELSRRGISPGSGIGAGVTTGIQGQSAANIAGLMPAIYQNIAERGFGMQKDLLAGDISSREEASRFGLTGLNYASDTLAAMQKYALDKQGQDILRDQANREFRLKQQQALGEAVGQFGPDIFREAKRYLDRRGNTNELNDMASGIMNDINNSPYQVVDGMAPEQFGFPKLPDSETPSFSSSASNALQEMWRNINSSPRAFTRGTQLGTTVNLDSMFPATLPFQIVTDPKTKLRFMKMPDGSWRKQ
jgi:hypothetical protein